MKNWFISDLHFSHASILYFHPERREAAGITLDELKNNKHEAVNKHDEWLIKLWNATISKSDSVYILGDFCLGNRERTESIIKRLNGHKYIIYGNHDKSLRGLERYFEWCGTMKELKFNHTQYNYIDPNETFCLELCHFPLYTWNRRPHGTCHLHGHTHGAMDEINTNSKELRIDVGLDGKLASMKFIELKTIYDVFTRMKDDAGFATFEEYNADLMLKQGVRL